MSPWSCAYSLRQLWEGEVDPCKWITCHRTASNFSY